MKKAKATKRKAGSATGRAAEGKRAAVRRGSGKPAEGEVDFRAAGVRRNPYAARIAREGLTVQVGRGRPKRLLETGPTTPRSVRFPPAVWGRIEKEAARKGLSLHAALREAILVWLREAA